MFTNFAFLVLAIVCLWLGAELLTKAALHIAKSMALSEGFIGLTIVALGTSFPEITMTMTGALQKLAGQSDPSAIVLGNLAGSSIDQLTLVIALAGLFRVMHFRKNTVFFDAAFAVVAVAVFYVVAQDGIVSRAEGFLCVLFYIFYLMFLWRRNFLERLHSKVKRKLVRHQPKLLDILQLFLGLLVVAKASTIVLAKGVLLSSQLGVSEATVGILILGFGASLPELVVSLSAAMNGALSLSINNLVGSSVVNVFLALGGGAMISAWNVDRSLVQFDLPYLLFSTIVVVLFILTKNKLERNESLLILSLFATYISLKIMGF